MDPQQRLLLEVASRRSKTPAAARALAGSATGVYVGVSLHDYRDLRLGYPRRGDRHSMTGGTLSHRSPTASPTSST